MRSQSGSSLLLALGLLVLIATSACAPRAVVPTNPAPLPTANISPVAPATPTSTLRPLPTVVLPTTPAATPAFVPLAVSPTAATIPAGGTFTFGLGPEGWDPYMRWRPDWSVVKSVEGLPPGATATFIYAPAPFVGSPAIMTSCLTPPGTYTLTFRATGPGVNQTAQAKLTVTAPLPDSLMGTFTTTDELTSRWGGPTTMQSAIFSVVSMCDTVPPRRLRVTIQSATSYDGTPLTTAQKMTVYRNVRQSVPGNGAEIFTEMGADALAIKPDRDSISPLASFSEWSLSGGPYLLVFGENFLGDRNPRDKRLATLTYTLEQVE